ncbi:MAG: hypothetical protein JXA39_02400 [Bacteroidales bacterium]|nr:hypothetical protein [Bacteroidales bacterium]
MKKLMIACTLLTAFFTAIAQNEIQALRYSRYNMFGTARYSGMGGAMDAVGGDFSVASTNPAGLAIFRNSEMSFTPSFYWVNSSSNLNGQVNDDYRFNFNVGSLGMVSVYNTRNDKGFISGTLGLGYNSLVNFNNRTTIRTPNGTSSLLDDFTWHANESATLSPFYEELAFDTYLMPYDSVQGYYWHDMEYDGYGQEQVRIVEQSGYIGEYTLSGAFNFGNLLYIGGTFGIHAVRFYEDIYHEENDLNETVEYFDSFTFREYNSTRGVGYTGKFGMILRPINLLRLSAAVHLPVYYNLTDEKFTDMSSTWDSSTGFNDESASSPNGIYDYKLSTPFRFLGSAAVVLGKLAVISAGYEYVDYSTARLNSYDYKFFAENNLISSVYRGTHNVKAGGEFRLGSLYFRGGGQYRMSPYTDSRNDADIWLISAGIGVRTQKIFFDASYTHSLRSEVYGMYAYQPGSYETSYNDFAGNNILLTLGFKF